MYIPTARMIKDRQHILRSLAVSGSRISQQISLQFVPPAPFCICGTLGNVFRNVDTIKKGRSEPRAKKAKKERKMQILIRAPVSFTGFLYLSAGGALARGRIFFSSPRNYSLFEKKLLEAVWRWILSNTVKSVTDLAGDVRGTRGPTSFWVNKEEITEGRKANRVSKSKPGPPLSLGSTTGSSILAAKATGTQSSLRTL